MIVLYVLFGGTQSAGPLLGAAVFTLLPNSFAALPNGDTHFRCRLIIVMALRPQV